MVGQRQGAKSALARWVLTQRRRRRGPAADAPTPRDEATHAWDGRRRFAEDYTFTAVGPGVAVIARLEWLPGRDANRIWLTILRDGEAFVLPGGQAMHRSTPSDRWRSGGLRLDCITPLQRWTIQYAGRLVAVAPGAPGCSPRAPPPSSRDTLRCHLDLTFVANADPYTPGTDDDPDLLATRLSQAQWDRSLLKAVRRVTNRGYVQLGLLHGTIALGDALIPLAAPSLRQHFWGVRDWGASDHAFQCFVADDDGAQAWIHHARFPFVTMEGGFARGATPSKHEPIAGLSITCEPRAQRAPAHATLVVPRDNHPAPLHLAMRSDCAFLVDGRGVVALGLARVTGDTEGWALWGGQRRWLPRR